MTNKEIPNWTRRLKTLLVSEGCTQERAAQQLGITSATFSNKLSGKIRFSAEELSRLADFLGTNVDVILGRAPLVFEQLKEEAKQ